MRRAESAGGAVPIILYRNAGTYRAPKILSRRQDNQTRLSVSFFAAREIQW